VGVGTLNNDYTVNGLLATTDHTYLQGNFGISMKTLRGQIWFGNQPEVGGPTHFHIMKGDYNYGNMDLIFGDDSNYVKLPAAENGVEITATTDGQQSAWQFTGDGAITFPDATVQTTAWLGDYQIGNIDMDGGAASTVYSVNVKFAEGGYASTRFSKNDTAYIGANAYGAEEPEFTLDGGKA
jgi:hypothetical protein